MRVLVCGGRDYADRDRLDAVLDRLHAERGFALVIAGGARGADTLAAEWANAQGVPCEVYMAEWERLGRKAGPTRNERMLAEGKPDLVVGFPGDRGTTHMCRVAREAGVEVIEVQRERTILSVPGWERPRPARKVGVGFNQPIVLDERMRFDWRERFAFMRRLVRMPRPPKRPRPWPLPVSVIEASGRLMGRRRTALARVA
jgi:hypothetical protein